MTNLIVVLDKLFLIKSVKMSGHCLGDDRSDLLRLHLRLALKLKSLISLHVGGLTFKPLGFVLRKPYNRGAFLANLFEHFVVLLQFPLLLFREVLFVARLTFEGQRVEWVLRMLLMEDVIIAVLPIRETFLVGRLANNRLPLIVGPLDHLLLWLHLEILVSVAASGAQIHLMWVDYLRLLLQVERFTILQHDGVLQLVGELFLVAGAQALGIGVPDELVRAPGLSTTLVPGESVGVQGGGRPHFAALGAWVLAVSTKWLVRGMK